MPYAAIIQQVLAGIQAAINAWPEVQGIIVSGKAMIAALFEAGKITKDDQTAVHTYIDGLSLMAQQGLIPPALRVDPDPITPAATVTDTKTTTTTSKTP